MRLWYYKLGDYYFFRSFFFYLGCLWGENYFHSLFFFFLIIFIFTFLLWSPVPWRDVHQGGSHGRIHRSESRWTRNYERAVQTCSLFFHIIWRCVKTESGLEQSLNHIFRNAGAPPWATRATGRPADAGFLTLPLRRAIPRRTCTSLPRGSGYRTLYPRFYFSWWKSFYFIFNY